MSDTTQSSENLTQDKDSLNARFNALVAQDGEGYHLVAADHFLFQEAKTQKQKDEQKKKDRDLRDITRSISDMVSQMDDMMNNMDFENDCLDMLNWFQNTQDRLEAENQALLDAIENEDFDKNPDGSFTNKAIQQWAENYKRKTGKDAPSDPILLIPLLQNTIRDNETVIDFYKEGEKQTTALMDEHQQWKEEQRQIWSGLKDDFDEIQDMSDGMEKEQALDEIERKIEKFRRDHKAGREDFEQRRQNIQDTFMCEVDEALEKIRGVQNERRLETKNTLKAKELPESTAQKTVSPFPS